MDYASDCSGDEAGLLQDTRDTDAAVGGQCFAMSSYFAPANPHKLGGGPQTLGDLEPLPPSDVPPRKLLAALPAKHFNEKERLRIAYEERFHEWVFQLRQGFNLLFYGFGSKRALLEKFARDAMRDGGVLAVNCTALGLTARHILQKAAGMVARLSGHQTKCMDNDALLGLLRSAPPGRRLYLLLHNMEGLADAAEQALLSEAAACPALAVAASMDHVNGPLLWDKQAGSRFNWLWHDVTNYAPYCAETAHLPSLLVGRSEEKAVVGASMVLRTLVPKARDVFRIIAQHTLDEAGEPGVTFPHLFREARERFLVQNEMTLRAHLAEFRDHELVATRRGADGADVLVVPLESVALQSLLAELEQL